MIDSGVSSREVFIPLQKDVQSKNNNNVETNAVIVPQPEHGV